VRLARRELQPFRWEELEDGLPRRLVRGRHFDVPAPEFELEAREVGARMGRVVRTVIDKISADCVWVQFAQAEIAAGSPCVCGERQFRRLSGEFVRCEACGALLVVRQDGSPQTDAESGASSGKAPKRKRPDLTNLGSFSDVTLVEYERWPTRQRFCGHGVLPDGRRVLLLVDVPTPDGDEVLDPHEALERPHNVASFPIEPFGRMIDLDALERRE
jgi:hypothetical protein